MGRMSAVNVRLLADDDIDRLVYESGPDANHYALVEAVEQIVGERVAQALHDAAADPDLRLSGHSGISITRLRRRANGIGRES
jgi:hypothetical protein